MPSPYSYSLETPPPPGPQLLPLKADRIDRNPNIALAAVFGKDIFCTTSLRTGRFASGLKLVAQNAFHRLTTPRGMLRGGEDESDYGMDLSGLVGSMQSDSDAAAIPGKIRSELLKDSRILDVESQASVSRDPSGAITVTTSIHCQTAEGPFELVLGISAVTTELLKMVA